MKKCTFPGLPDLVALMSSLSDVVLPSKAVMLTTKLEQLGVIRCSDSVTNCSIGSGVVENVGVAFGIVLISQFSAEISHAIKCDFKL
jgi:hypothetical protein